MVSVYPLLEPSNSTYRHSTQINEKLLFSKRLVPRFIAALLIIAKKGETTQMCIEKRMGKQIVAAAQRETQQQ